MSFLKKSFDFVAIGDITTDAFIRLKEANVNCDINEEHCTISMKFGDKIPYESVTVVSAVGNAPNASVAAARLGIPSALVSNMGNDENGKKCLDSLTENKVDTRFVSVHKGRETNYHYALWYEHDRTILVKHQEYEYRLPDIGAPKWIYLSSLGASTHEYHKEISEYLKTHPEVKLAFQPGTFQISLGTEVLKDIYARTEVFVSNIEEAERILNVKTLGTTELIKHIHGLGPKIVILTDGPKGAYASDGSSSIFMPVYPQKPAFERTGAGDAFASTFVSAMILGKDIPTALQWASTNSMSVVQEIGAQKGLLSQKEIEKYLAKAPSDFKAQKIS